jgi:hypothetical protein
MRSLSTMSVTSVGRAGDGSKFLPLNFNISFQLVFHKIGGFFSYIGLFTGKRHTTVLSLLLCAFAFSYTSTALSKLRHTSHILLNSYKFLHTCPYTIETMGKRQFLTSASSMDR